MYVTNYFTNYMFNVHSANKYNTLFAQRFAPFHAVERVASRGPRIVLSLQMVACLVLRNLPLVKLQPVMHQHAGHPMEIGLTALEAVMPLAQGPRPGLAYRQQMEVNPAQM